MEQIKFIEIQIDNLKRSLYALTKMGDTFISVTPFRILKIKREIKNFEKVKQDLEVLEIIRKKRVDVIALESRLNAFKDDNERILYSYNAMFYNKKIYKLTMEELLKLKQWLEVNENDIIK